VRIHGVKAGVVERVDLVGGEPVMTLRVEKRYAPIYRDAKLRIRPVTPLDDLYVNVTDRGTPRAGVADASYVIPAQNTITPVDISRVLDTFDADTRERLTTLMHEMGPAMQDGGQKLQAAFVELAPFLDVARDATRVLAERRRNVRRLVHNFGSLSGALAERDAQIGKLVRGGASTLGELGANDGPLGATIGAVPPALTAMRGSFAGLRRLEGELDPALQSLRPVAAGLDDGLKGLQRFGTDATPALRALRPALDDLRPMARTLVPTSRSLESAFGTLRPQAPQLNRLTQTLVPCLGMAQDFFAHTLSVFKFEDSVGAFPRAEMTVDTDGYAHGDAGGLNTRPVPSCTRKGG
jgi:ABC-type transporter Mla subunit MlaD